MTATALIIDDDPAYARSLVRLVKHEGFSTEVAYSGEEALEMVHDVVPELAIVDLALPGIDGVEVIWRLKKIKPSPVCIAVSGSATPESAVAAMHAGAFDFLTKTSELEEIRFKLQKALEVAELRRKVQFLMDRDRHHNATQMIGESAVMKQVYSRIKEIARTPDTTVLILGETGTGKDLVARAIHEMSDRKGRALVSVNCTAVPDNLMESEFFGHERGAFTSADRKKKGLVELANEGTLFLDEIGDLDLGLQGKLLRLIEDRRYKRVGGVKDFDADVRFITATNRDLEDMVREGRFREDLLYRLNVFQIVLPPLRERTDDILLLTRHFIQQFSEQMNKEVLDIDGESSRVLLQYPFPGNVRQLKNMVEQAMILTQGQRLTIDQFPGIQRSSAGPTYKKADSWRPDKELSLDQRLKEIRHQELVLEDLEGEIFREALAKSGGNKTKAAQLLEISRYALQRRIRRLENTSNNK